MIRFAAVLVGAASLITAAHAAPPNAVMLSLNCSGCHGTLGASAGDSVPSLAGQPKESFVTAMKKFRSGERPSTVMGRLAAGYTDAEIESMAGFFARFKPARQTAPIDARLAERGRNVFYQRCKYCHLDPGPLWRQIHRNRDYDNQCRHCHADYGNPGGEPTPLVAGQWLQYLSLQLDAFAEGKRPMSKAKAEKLRGLSREDREAVANFYASQVAE
ncbi:MAG: c-type cytochrome [Ignavibacteria bacterium]